jgi:hypothetical protein
VTVTVAVIGAALEFIAAKLGMVLAVPEVGVKPMVLLLIDQLYVAGLIVALKVLAATVPCEHMVTLDKFCISGFGFTVMVNVEVGPLQPFAVGVTTIVLIWAILVVF